MSSLSVCRHFKTLLAVGAVACLNSLSAATVTYTGSNAGSWSSPSSWSSGSVPVIGDEVKILHSGSTGLRVKGNTSYAQPGIGELEIDGSGGGWSILELSKNLTVDYFTRVGWLGKGAIEQKGGNQDFNYLWLGAGHTDASGRYTLKKGNVTANQIIVGGEGAGDFEQLKGNVNVGQWLVVGNYSDTDSTYTLTRGKLSVHFETSVGRMGRGNFEQSGGTASLGNLYVGLDSDGVGSVKQSGGKMLTNSVTIGKAGTGSVEQSGGTHSVAGNITVGGLAGGTATYSVQGGSLEVGGRIIVGGTGGQGSFVHTGGKVSADGGVQVMAGECQVQNTTLSTRGLSVGTGATFRAQGTKSAVRTTGDVLLGSGADITTRDATLIVGKGSSISLSAIQSDAGGSSLSLSGAESWSAISLEKNVTLSLQGTAGVDAIYVNSLDIGSKNPFRVESIIVGNGVNVYYNADLRSNRYLKGGTYDLAEGGQLIPVHIDSGSGVTDTGVLAGLGKIGSGSLVLTGSNTWSPDTEILGGSLVVAGGQFAFELGTGGIGDELQYLGEGAILEISAGSFELFDFTLVDSSLTAPGAFILVDGDWQIYTPEGGSSEASGTLSESMFSTPPTSTVPEPGSVVLVILGIAGFCARRSSRSGGR